MKFELFAAAMAVSILMLGGVAADEEDNTDVAVSVEYSCSTSVREFEPPGEGFIAENATGYFDADIENTGNFPSNVSVEYINVTKQNGTYDRGDPLGPVVEAFNGSNVTNLPPDDDPNTTSIEEDSITYAQQFNATYDQGWYAGHINVSTNCDLSNANNESQDFENFSVIVHNSFKIIENFGEGGGVNTTGNLTTNRTFPEDINSTGNQSINDTLPQNVTRPGEDTNQPLEGDNDAPGLTPEPEPEPEPRVLVDVEPVNRTYTVSRGSFGAAGLTVRNIGNISVGNLAIEPYLADLGEGWEARGAEVANLSVGENVSRDVFVQPPEDAELGLYTLPVQATDSEGQVDLDFITLDVRRANFTPRLSILESPQSVNLEVNSNQSIPVLIENAGRRELQDVTAEVQNVEDCGQVSTPSVGDLEVNQTSSVQIEFSSAGSPESCNATLIVSSSDGAYAFSNIGFEITPEEGLIPPEQRVPFIAIAWTAVLVAYAVLRKRYELDSFLVQAPFVMLLMGETLILTYMVVNYYGLVSLSFLPF